MADFYNSLPSLFGAEEPICPYTGLRTFTEDEAIYFRGRESHVGKCLDLLAERRFVMITGASGDGKSSLVFAGLLPEVRAGFLRARYSSWAVATFRPERSPLRNLAQSLATALQLESSAAAIETELEQGFSALVQLYQTSPLCPPAELPAGLTPAEQRRYQLKASNLLIVVDQFEEFFTNPENYTRDGPNAAAQTVVNLLLETTQLAQAEGLPIYIACTMRSDFVGQCAEFRGLIEQVGASQYFVPRLLRHEFVEVIREPALLSGNRISERLVQRLLYDIRQGQDQLPVLQHALRRIWLAADQGREEMDLLHYAMVGGLSDELPAADQPRFVRWQATLPAQQREFLLADASLRNVLDAHANQLYHGATDRYNQTFAPPLLPGTAERVIEQAFRVLTRTDGQRVVRNRLTGAEITAIINDAALPWPVVCRILRPFRQPGTTFLSPFLNEDEDDQAVLPLDAVLDLTHESLIRNWDHLAQWAVQEAEDVRVAEDFMQQASRWQENGKSRDFLLPIGSYSYFAQWSQRKPNMPAWLAHYTTGGRPGASAEAGNGAAVSSGNGAGRPRSPTSFPVPANAPASVLTRFLAASRRRLTVPLLVARFGAGRLAAAVLVPLLLLGLGRLMWYGRQQQSDYIAYTIVKERTPYLKSPYVVVDDKALFLLHTDRLKNMMYRPDGQPAGAYAFPRMLDALGSDSLALGIELSMYAWANNMDYDSVERENPYARQLLFDLSRRLDAAAQRTPLVPGQPVTARQRATAVYSALAAMAHTYHLLYAGRHRVALPEPLAAQQAANRRLEANKQRMLHRLYNYVRQEVQDTTGAAPSANEFGFCLRVLLGQGNFQPAELAFLESLNPFGMPASRRQFRRLFPPELRLYAAGGSTAHSGGYLSGAIVFAARRQPAQVARCLDSLRTQVSQLNYRDGGIALLPYLVKYSLFTPENTLDLLRRCSRVGEFSFNRTYAAAVCCLLSESPANSVYDVGPSYGRKPAQDEGRTGAVNPDYLNSDRVSFSVPVAVRDHTWQALWQAAPQVAAAEPLFAEQGGQPFSGPAAAARRRRNGLFLQAFLAKMHGVYLHELKHRPAEAAQAFARFSAGLQALEQAGPLGTSQLKPSQWSLGLPETINLTDASRDEQDAGRFLREPTRPKTLLFETYHTCSFNSFFLYQLRREAAQPVPDQRVVQLLDSVSFVEAAFPDRCSSTRYHSLRTAALSRLRQDQPNLTWIGALNTVPGPPARRQRNALLLTLAATLQSPIRLQRFTLTPALRSFIKNLPNQPAFSQEPWKVVLSDLATALAFVGRIPEAMELAGTLARPMATITKIRVAEQAMLTDNLNHQQLLDDFLEQYRRQVSRQPSGAGTSVIGVLCWRPYNNEKGSFNYDVSYNPGDVDFVLPDLASFLIREGNSTVHLRGQLAMCKGRSFGYTPYYARLDIPAYESQRVRQPYFNAVLLGVAHTEATTPGSGWREFDEVQLVYPKDYDGLAE
ncbi:energy-coupling factor transporter ATP-binding protein EcfA2 [Hymenobacter sp. UYAg731]